VKSVSLGQRVWVDLHALYEPTDLVRGDVGAWGIGTVIELGNGEPGVSLELECADGTGEPARAPLAALITYPIPFRSRGR
jgi:hypothetical protein